MNRIWNTYGFKAVAEREREREKKNVLYEREKRVLELRLKAISAVMSFLLFAAQPLHLLITSLSSFQYEMPVMSIYQESPFGA